MLNLKDLHYRQNYLKNEIDNKIIKAISKTKLNYLFLLKNKNLVSKVKLSNNCVLSGRTRSVYRKIKISRIKLKELTKKQSISGFKITSW